MENKHSQSVPTEVLEQANALVEQLANLLTPYLLSLTPDERREMSKMGDKTRSFVVKAGEFARSNPQFCPTYLNLEDFMIDINDATGLMNIENKVKQVADNLDDTMMVSGSEAYGAALVFYHSVQNAAKQDIPGAKTIYEELKQRFPGRPSTRKTVEK